MIEELRVPTVALTAEVLCSDGRSVLGRIFLPAASSSHEGPMRAEEWANDAVPFFPFLPDESETPVILNKDDVLVVSVASSADASPDAELVALPERRVVVECGGRSIEGTVRIGTPDGQGRVLDYMNHPEPFLTLHDSERDHLIRKRRITRVIEVPGD
jgi:hypothetical protein